MLNEHLAPLRRYLHRQAGRPWNKVYSEICAGLRAGHPLHDHVRQHVFDYVDVNNAWTQRPLWLRKEFYVDPHTGLLRIRKRRRPKP